MEQPSTSVCLGKLSRPQSVWVPGLIRICKIKRTIHHTKDERLKIQVLPCLHKKVTANWKTWKWTPGFRYWPEPWERYVDCEASVSFVTPQRADFPVSLVACLHFGEVQWQARCIHHCQKTSVKCFFSSYFVFHIHIQHILLAFLESKPGRDWMRLSPRSTAC